MKSFLNYLGQFRLYSFVDLLLFLVAIKGSSSDFLGIIFLHLGFLAFLESKHAHAYRKTAPKAIWILLGILGVTLYRHWEIIPFIVFSYLYTKKNHDYWALFSPVFRGLQYFFLTAGILGYHNPLPWIALILISIRNLVGDFRDTKKDRIENMKTLPALVNMSGNYKHAHLIAILATSIVWWTFTTLSPLYLIIIMFIEVSTYNLTPR